MKKPAMKYSGIGGQAVLEGIMMRNGDKYALAVRCPDGSIAKEVDTYKGIFGDKITKIPFVRGIFNFIDSLVLGIRTLTASAKYFEDEEEGESSATDGHSPSPSPKAVEKKESSNGQKALMGVTVGISFAIAIVIFMLIPVWLSNLLKAVTDNYWVIALFEGLLRIAIFIGYVAIIGRMKDIKRTYMYHGSEHKCINCIEHGLPLTVENVAKSSKEHKRCGTSFMLIVLVISVLLFMFIRTDTLALRMLSRILLIPVIAGLSYEFLRLAGRSSNPVVDALSRPGMWLQGLTTKEPTKDMIEVAIVAVEAVFDWREYQEREFGAPS